MGVEAAAQEAAPAAAPPLKRAPSVLPRRPGRDRAPQGTRAVPVVPGLKQDAVTSLCVSGGSLSSFWGFEMRGREGRWKAPAAVPGMPPPSQEGASRQSHPRLGGNGLVPYGGCSPTSWLSSLDAGRRPAASRAAGLLFIPDFSFLSSVFLHPHTWILATWGGRGACHWPVLQIRKLRLRAVKEAGYKQYKVPDSLDSCIFLPRSHILGRVLCVSGWHTWPWEAPAVSLAKLCAPSRDFAEKLANSWQESSSSVVGPVFKP